MLKTCVTALLGLVLFFGNAFSLDAEAATKKKKSETSVSQSKNKNSKKKNKKKKARLGKARRYKRSGNGPDLRALTTESPTNTEFTEAPGNGVNPVETKPGL
ncbi:hypothetical protein DOM21_09720 [Bacteriovorax stolpii]|uniref:Uncharacterized protein n=1 Tax=Bacteriovorax stolpii TaxID=960 RepID=A0A2K9NT87_BACTC|nr:hypothetical protein [Bacteriovorax stolpii]AUN98295.1 hypothetical protein C0V70_09300 [Bacteriovorax stolpii]QDK41725.1 hypothetical protein DOM21_09720 [Bacteriovorax stolpii]TDP52220.1 hypothetical protein C8D79_2870 [Bacteriovorax stolpii]